MPAHPDVLGLRLGEFINELLQEGEAKGRAGCAISGLSLFPRIRYQLPVSMHAVVVNSDQGLQAQRSTARALAGCWSHGRRCPGPSQAQSGTLLPVFFLPVFFFEMGELFVITPQDIQVLPHLSQITVALPHTKTGRGRAQSASFMTPG